MEFEITSENFETEVINSQLPVLVDFRASWCQICAELAPILSEIATCFDGKIKVGKINIDNEIALTTKYNVTSVPTLVLIKGGEEKAKNVGVMSQNELMQFVMENI